MSSFGSGGGSTSGSTGGTTINHPLMGLDLGAIRQLAQQQFQQIGQPQSSIIQPGQMAQQSPQQRLASVLRMYGGGA
jgi:hypothetical protein